MERPLDSLPPALRRAVLVVWGIVFLGGVFVLFPILVVTLGEERGWPRWRSPPGQAVGAVLFVGGLALSLYCSRLFARVGRGTPIPVAPPRELVVSGIYGYTRNPIYVGQVAILLGIFFLFGHVGLLVHALAWALLVHGYVVLVEEPGLRRRFGEAYARYAREVPRWVGVAKRMR